MNGGGLRLDSGGKRVICQFQRDELDKLFKVKELMKDKPYWNDLFWDKDLGKLRYMEVEL